MFKQEGLSTRRNWQGFPKDERRFAADSGSTLRLKRIYPYEKFSYWQAS